VVHDCREAPRPPRCPSLPSFSPAHKQDAHDGEAHHQRRKNDCKDRHSPAWDGSKLLIRGSWLPGLPETKHSQNKCREHDEGAHGHGLEQEARIGVEQDGPASTVGAGTAAPSRSVKGRPSSRAQTPCPLRTGVACSFDDPCAQSDEPERSHDSLRFGPLRVPYNLPEMAVGILEVARVASPERLVRGLDDDRTCAFGLSHDRIDFFPGRNIVPESELSGARPSQRYAGVVSNALARPDSQLQAGLQIKKSVFLAGPRVPRDSGFSGSSPLCARWV
jgi:hypothetical protein